MGSTTTGRTLALLAALLPSLLLQSCTTKISEQERQNIAVAYAEMLIVKNMYRADSLKGAKMADSVVRHYGFDGEGELMGKIKDLGHDQDALRAMIDSAQKRLERVQQGINPDSIPRGKPAGKSAALPSVPTTKPDSATKQ